MTERRPPVRRRGAKAAHEPADDGRQVDLVAILSTSSPDAPRVPTQPDDEPKPVAKAQRSARTPRSSSKAAASRAKTGVPVSPLVAPEAAVVAPEAAVVAAAPPQRTATSTPTKRRSAKVGPKPAREATAAEHPVESAQATPAPKPASTKPAAAKSAATKRAAAAPAATKRAAAAPAATKPVAAKPVTAKPVTAKAITAKPAVAKPVAAKPAAAKPVAAKAVVAEAEAPKAAADESAVTPRVVAPVRVAEPAPTAEPVAAEGTPSTPTSAAAGGDTSAPRAVPQSVRRPLPPPVRRPPPPPVARESSPLAARMGIAPPGSAGRARPVIAPPGSAAGRQAEPAAASVAVGAIGARNDPPPRHTPPPPPPVQAQRPRDLDPKVPLGRALPERARIAPAGSATAGPKQPDIGEEGLGHVAAAAMAVVPAGGAIRAPVDARTRRQRFNEGASDESAPPAAVLPQSAPVPERPRVGLMLVNRNHGALLADVWQRWREILPGFEVRAIVLDLGSVDESFDQAELARLEVVSCPGGLVTPVHSLLAGLRHAPAEIVLVADVRAEPGAVGLGLVELVRQGAAIAVAAGRQPGLVAVDTRRLRADVQHARDLADLAAQLDLTLRVGGVSDLVGADADAGLVPKLADGRRRTLLRKAAERWVERAVRRLPGERWIRSKRA